MSFPPIFNLHLYLVMSESDSSLKLSFSCDSDDEFVFSEDLYENILFYLICQEPSTLLLPPKPAHTRDQAWRIPAPAGSGSGAPTFR